MFDLLPLIKRQVLVLSDRKILLEQLTVGNQGRQLIEDELLSDVSHLDAFCLEVEECGEERKEERVTSLGSQQKTQNRSKSISFDFHRSIQPSSPQKKIKVI
jgi:hypothetical protein